jgi:hypothetical protein
MIEHPIRNEQINAFRAKTIAQNEAAYAARVANAEKGRAARASAKRAVEP